MEQEADYSRDLTVLLLAHPDDIGFYMDACSFQLSVLRTSSFSSKHLNDSLSETSVSMDSG